MDFLSVEKLFGIRKKYNTKKKSRKSDSYDLLQTWEAWLSGGHRLGFIDIARRFIDILYKFSIKKLWMIR
jgi:hypothetical protein